jgi:hypothetical protein
MKLNTSTRVSYQTSSHNGEFRENLFNNCRPGPVALKGFVLYFHHFLTLENVADSVSRNVSDYHCTLRDIQKSEYFSRVTPILHLLQ